MQPTLGRLLVASGVSAFLATVAAAEGLPRFPPTAVWHQNISSAPLHPQSASMISTLAGLGGFGFGRMHIDFGFHVVRAQPGAPTRAITWDPEDYYAPDCEPIGASMPVPPGAAIEGQSGLTCDNASDDCHLLVVQGDVLFEAYRVTEVDAATVEAQCLAIWDLTTVYPPEGRGDHCTSADAAGFPIAPLLFNADEIAAALSIDPSGDTVDLGHAIRFILPNARMAADASLGGDDGNLYVRPASHAGDPDGPVGSVPYGSRLRLRSDFPRTGYNPAARVILNTFARYGIVLSDGGNVALTAESDLYTSTKWVDLDIDSRLFDLTLGAADVAVTDFHVLDTGPRIAETYECERSTPAWLFGDDFEGGNTAAWSAEN
jgi:serine/threonine-protein kinase